MPAERGPTGVEGMRAAVVGASLAGLSAANVLVRLGMKEDVLEAFETTFHHRGGALGHVDVGLVRSILGGGSHSKLRTVRGHGHYYGDLWETLYDALPAGTVKFGEDVQVIDEAETKRPKINGVAYDLIVGADGGKSTTRR